MANLIGFDLVGTLVRPECFSDARKSINVDTESWWQAAQMKVNFEQVFDYVPVFDAWIEILSSETLHKLFKDYLLGNVNKYLYSEVCTVLMDLADGGIRLAFVTDGSNDVEGLMIRKILQGCGIEADRCIVVTAQEVGAGKATGKPFEELVRQARGEGVEGKDIVFVGDKWSADVDGPKRIGLRAVLLERGSGLGGNGIYKPDGIVNDLSELRGLLKGNGA